MGKWDCPAEDNVSDKKPDEPGNNYYFYQYSCKTMAKHLQSTDVNFSANYEIIGSSKANEKDEDSEEDRNISYSH